MDTVEVDGFRIAYERSGHGPPLVLLHGYVGDGPTTWRPQLEAMSDEFTVVAWDAPGAGGSSDPPEDFGMAGFADSLAGFIGVLGLDQPHVVGLSFGGALALELCRRHPALPRSLVLASAYAGWAGSLSVDATAQRLQQALTLSDLSADEFAGALLPTMFSAATPAESVAAFGVAMRAFHPVGFRAMARASAEDLRSALPLVQVETLVMCGDHDVRAPMAVALGLHAAIAGSTLVVLPDTGHVCNIERPDEFNSALRTFLRGVRTHGVT